MEESGEVKVKKRQKHGRISEVVKKLRLQSNMPGNDCKCKKLKCFTKICEDVRNKILQKFNSLPTYNDQNSYLTGLISLIPVQRRRPRKPENEVSKFKDSSYQFRVRVLEENEVGSDIQVCYKAFLAIHGITGRRIQTIQHSLKMSGSSPIDKRGKHTNRKHALAKETKDLVIGHFSSFKARSSHYSLNKTKKTYLPEELSVLKMHSMFKEKYPNCKISYDSYRQIFNTKFNIAFGYPRSDTCSFCDETNIKLKNLRSELSKGIQKDDILKDLQRLEVQQKLHLKKAETFYQRKTTAKKESRKVMQTEAICIDYTKNLPVPNISTNDAYYCRKLSVYTFVVHFLSTNDATFYSYPETEGKKGSSEVCSLIHHMLYNDLDYRVRELNIFCDSCAGQNKNWTMFRYLHHVIHFQRRLDSISVTFPVRGHSYMECDKDFSVINQKTTAETPEDWISIFQSSRNRPAPFKTESVNHTFFRQWNEHLKGFYKKTCPFPTRSIKELKLSKQNPRLLYYRTTYNGNWQSADIVGKSLKLDANGEFEMPPFTYKDPLPLTLAKYRDIEKLSKFCRQEAQDYLRSLPH